MFEGFAPFRFAHQRTIGPRPASTSSTTGSTGLRAPEERTAELLAEIDAFFKEE